MNNVTVRCVGDVSRTNEAITVKTILKGICSLTPHIKTNTLPYQTNHPHTLLLPRSFVRASKIHVSTRNLVSAVSWCCHLDRKKEGSTAALPLVCSPETGHIQCSLSSTKSDTFVLTVHFTLHVIACYEKKKRDERRGCPPAPLVLY